MLKNIIIFSSLTLIAILIITFICLYNKYSKLVIQNSERLRKLFELNNTTTFNIINKKQYSFHQICNSKRQLDRLILNDYFIGIIEQDIEYFNNIYEPIHQNRNNYNRYINNCKKIKTEATDEMCKQLKTKLKKFTSRENKLFKKNQLMPSLDIYIEIITKFFRFHFLTSEICLVSFILIMFNFAFPLILKIAC